MEEFYVCTPMEVCCVHTHGSVLCAHMVECCVHTYCVYSHGKGC